MIISSSIGYCKAIRLFWLSMLASIIVMLGLIIRGGLQKDYGIIIFAVCMLIMTGVVYRILYLPHQKYKLKNSIYKVDDLITNIASVVPNIYEVDYVEKKTLVYLGDIKGALHSKFSCAIRLMACGSIPERFAVPLSKDWTSAFLGVLHTTLVPDQDFLIELTGITASYSAQPHIIEIVQSESFIEEGYAKLRVTGCMSRRFNLEEGFLSTDTIKYSVKPCITSQTNQALRKSQVFDSLGEMFNSRIHGPAINMHTINSNCRSLYLVDLTFAIPCLEWPPESDWPFRNKMWPDHGEVKTIKDLGFHFVPKSQKKDKSKLTWRYSFSLAERELSKEVNEIARNCFLCLKAISSDHLKPICKRFSSYHLTTILFRTLEVTSAEMWSEKNILNCLEYFLKEFQKAFHQKECWHFWISSINLFQNFNHHRLSKLEEKVKEIQKNPAPFMFSYTFCFIPSCLPFKKNEKELPCFCFSFKRFDWFLKSKIKESRKKIRNSMSKEVAAEEVNHVFVTTEEAPLNIHSYPVRSYGSFNQKENL